VSVPRLTPIEERIVLFVAAGGSVEDIAAELGVGARTVEWHLARARRKLEQAAALHVRVEQATQGGR
jgi:DNA-binding CsgD family transcriptional regulator